MSFSTYTSGLNYANGLAFDNNNNLYIADGGANNIIKVDTLGNKSVFVSGFNYTQNVVFDNIGFPNGYLYVMDNSNTIYKVDVNGNKTTFITNLGTHYFGMAFDVNNNLYYCNADASNIYKINTSGTTTLFITGGSNLSYPLGIAFDNNGNLFVANFDNKYIFKYNSNGTLINNQFISFPNNSLGVNLIIDANNNIYACYTFDPNASGHYLNKYDSNGTLISTIYNDTTGTILGLAFDSMDNLYFTNNNATTITKYAITIPIVCFKEGSMILTNTGYKPIQDLRKGDLVKTLKHDFKPIEMIGKREIYHPALQERIKDQLYECSQDNFDDVFEPLIITGCHSILVDNFVSEKQKNNAIEINNGRLFITDGKYRLPTCVDERAKVYEIPGNYTIYHLALENDDYYMNYGIYANGLLVETCSKRYLKELSNMTLIE